MTSLPKPDPRRMYSWWWNSHISPKNSKWLQENLTDVDIKVKAMIKLIEEDADSFARRAEMYYKKRPELMKLVEELYRAYRSLAERYDHATGALRQAHKTMTEAFPNQVPTGCDDSAPCSPYDTDPHTPDSKTTTIFDPVDLQVDGSRGTARKALNFSDSEDVNSYKNGAHDQNLESVGVDDKEILVLKEALAKLEDEKEAGLKQYIESLDKLSKLKSEILKSQEESRDLACRASKAEAESEKLKDMLQNFEAEKVESLDRYKQAEKKIEEINEQNLKQEIGRLRDERDTAYDQYKQSLNLISDLEKKLLEAEKEIETLKLAFAKLTEEKEAQAVLYQKRTEMISSLERRLVCAEEEIERLQNEISNGVLLLKGAEEQHLVLEKSNESLHMQLESTAVKIESQSEEITEKQKELGRLWTCIQEERLRFVEAETAFQTLQQLHAQSQDDLRSMAGELQSQAENLRKIEDRNRVLEQEIQKHIKENKNLIDLNLSSSISLKEMQAEIISLKEFNGKLEEEVDLRVDQRNALQQEIYCLKKELNELNKKHGSILEQVSYIGLNPESFGSSVKDLQDEHLNLKKEWQTEKSAKEALLEKLEIMGQLLERNIVLENSLTNVGDELEGVRGNLKSLEESYRLLSEEKSNLAVEKANLLGQLQVTTDNLSHVSEKNTVLENSLFDAHVKLEMLKQKSKSFEDSCQLLTDEKSALISEKGNLVSQMEFTEITLKDLETKYKDLEEKYSLMEKERKSTLQKVADLNVSLALQNQEYVTLAQKNDKQLHAMRSQIQLLQEESRTKNKEFEKEMDKAFSSEIEIFVFLNCVQDLEENNLSLFNDFHKLQEALRLLKQEKTENLIQIESLSVQNDRLKNGMHRLLEFAGLSLHPGSENGHEQIYFDSIQKVFEGTNHALTENEDKNTKLVVEISILITLLRQFRTECTNLEAEKRVIQKELHVRDEMILGLQREAREISEAKEGLRRKVIEGEINESGLRTQLENIQCEVSNVLEAFRTLQMENSVVLEENKSLLEDSLRVKNKICASEEENEILSTDVLTQSILCYTLKNYIDEKQEENNKMKVINDQQEKQILKLVQDNDHLSQENQILEVKMQKLMENLSKTEEKVRFLETEGSLVYGDLQNMKETKDQQEKQILKLLQDNDHLSQENQILEVEKQKLMENLSKNEEKVRFLETEGSLVYGDLQKMKATKDQQEKQILKLLQDNDHLSQENQILEVKMQKLMEHLSKTEENVRFLETEGSLLYGDLQTFTVYQVLLEDKTREFAEVCSSLKEETNILESKNGDLKACLAAYGPALESLKDSIISLENHTCIRTKVPLSENEDTQVGESVTMKRDDFLELQDLQSKVKVIEIAVTLSNQQKLDLDAKLESAMKRIEELSSQKDSGKSHRKPKSTSEISEADPKDIMLDHASECSSYSVSKRRATESEIWESADDPKGPKPLFKHNPTASDVSLGNIVDKLEVSRSFKEPHEDESKRKVLDRLNSDVLKLTNLQITIEDLKRKVETTLRTRRGKAMIECETLNGQLMEAESAIQKLYELNGKFVKQLEGEESGDRESTKRKKVAEQARRVSEKIGRLQLEVQKVQFVLFKLDETEGTGKSRFLDANKRVLLKDYLYGGGRTKATISSRRKKGHFCACVEPATKGD